MQKGNQGIMGPPGQKGKQGIMGPTGQNGEQGIMGKTGLKGNQGFMGPPVAKGDQGTSGPKGEQGIIGVPGPRGILGAKGEPGDSFTPPTTVIFPRKQTIAEKHNVVFQCSVIGNPKPTITWLGKGSSPNIAGLYLNPTAQMGNRGVLGATVSEPRSFRKLSAIPIWGTILSHNMRISRGKTMLINKTSAFFYLIY